MSQCVPSWDLDDGPLLLPKPFLRYHSNFTHTDVPMKNYEVAELTWENGHLAMHGLGPPRSFPNSKLTPTTAPALPSPVPTTANKYAGPTWPEKPRVATAGTLESLVNQATRFTHPATPHRKPRPGPDEDDEVVPWFDHRRRPPAGAAVTMDALVPSSTRVGSCSGRDDEGAKRARARGEWGGAGRDVQSVSRRATDRDRDRDRDRESQHVAMDTCESRGGGGVGLTSTSYGGSQTQTQDNTSYERPTCTTGKTVTADEDDSVCHSRPSGKAGDEEEEELQKKGNALSSGSTKRSRAAAIHNQSERKRRDKINQRMKTLQKLVPNSSKTDKASMLDEVIDYLKQLQAQVQMMGRTNMQPMNMMLPMAMQQQLQMSMMTPMSMGMGMGMGMGVMDMNSIARSNMAGLSPVIHPSAFMPHTSWDGSGGSDWLSATSACVMPDPLSTFLASQPVTMDAYSRMAALYQQLNQQPPPASSSKN